MYLPPPPLAPAPKVPRNPAPAGSEPHLSRLQPAPHPARPDTERQTRRRFRSRAPSIADNLLPDAGSRRFDLPRIVVALRSRADNTPLQNTNLTIGIVVGVVLALFFVGLGVFIWFFRNSIRFTRRKKVRRRRKSSGSKSSKSSKSSADSGEAPAMPPG